MSDIFGMFDQLLGPLSMFDPLLMIEEDSGLQMPESGSISPSLNSANRIDPSSSMSREL